MGIQPTQRRTTVTGVTVTRIDQGRVVEGWSQWDMAGLLAQLGVQTMPQQIARQGDGGRAQPMPR